MNVSLRQISLDDKYASNEGPIYLTGSQAILRLAMHQLRRDEVAGLDTACFISGYRGSPVHNVDKELWRAKRFVTGDRIHFQPGVNEDLAATSCWGSQQSATFSGAKHDGVFSLWYGKGPGLDRSIDAIRHGHLAGASAHGGVLVAVGDDPAMKSTDVPAASETMFADLIMPMLYPATVQEIIDYGLLGWEMSRFTGSWVGFKLVADTIDAAAVVSADPHRLAVVRPNFEFPPDGVSIRAGDNWLLQEARLRHYKIPAALAFSRANEINRRVIDGPNRRFGIISSGKAAMDVRQALHELGLDRRTAADIGISFLKIGMPFPFDAEAARGFADGLEEILVVEEKRRFLESRLRDALYDLPDGRRPRVVGRRDEAGEMQLPETGEFGPEEVARVIARRIAHFHTSERITARLAFLDAKAETAARRDELSVQRIPYFCSGCPHNTSTKVPEGSRAQGGVGCHYMATYMERETGAHTHMGGEGANWIGHEPFTETNHVFQNMGDGTYYHSGLLAIRACIAAEANITYKILFNDAVAMTGGQPLDGPLTPMSISRQVHAEGAKRIVVVTDDPGKYPVGVDFAPGTVVEHRRDLDRVQRSLRETPGVTVLIYDQTCAAEKRRRRKRGEMEDPPRRMFINHRVCEGCGDCSVTSNCLSVLPLETPFGRKRRIDQSSCNKDYSCAEGFCPSFVNVIGATLKRAAAGTAPSQLATLPEPRLPELSEAECHNILVTGIGGTGVVTIAALLTMAAHMEDKAFSTIDQFGMAQKGGAVTSHVRIALSEDALGAMRLSAGSADLVLGCDSLVTGGELALAAIDPARTHVVVNGHQAITGQFAMNPDLDFPSQALKSRLEAETGPGKLDVLDATRLATALLGDSIATNLFMLGFAYQKGLVPVSSAALFRAIELNGLAVDMNKDAFEWGRHAAHDPARVREAAGLGAPEAAGGEAPESLEEVIAHRMADLVGYQGAGYAKRYEAFVRRVAAAEEAAGPARGLAEAVARNLHKLMAYKDEYEVARLYSEPAFLHELESQLQDGERLELLLAPPVLCKPDPDSGRITKRTFGPWIFTALRWLARLKGLRGTAFDPFGRTEERRTERALIGEYETLVEEALAGLTPENHGRATAIAKVPEMIRGFGPVKNANIDRARAEWRDLMASLRQGDPLPQAAE